MAFLVFEGLDGSGKTTLIRRLEAELMRRNISVNCTREPGGTPLGEELRNLLLRTTGDTPTPRCELLLYEAIRAHHVETRIRPHLSQGSWVLCDRFTASTVAFQAGGRNLGPNDIQWLNQFATGGLTPDLTILLDISVNESGQRRKHRVGSTGVEQDRFELEQNEFHERVRNSYLAQAKTDPARWHVVSASLSPEELFDSLLETLVTRKWLT